MEMKGKFAKMDTVLDNPVHYQLNLGGDFLNINTWLGKKITYHFIGEIYCIHCGRKTNKSFSQGYCYPCFISLPETDESVVRPELNRAHEGISRNMEWSRKHDLIDHFVYLSFTSELKVGVTRHLNIPTRWIDQGAEYAIKLAKTPYRQLAGLIEVSLKPYLSDKTNWRKMLSSSVMEIPDMVQFKKHFEALVPGPYQKFIVDDNEVTNISYPVQKYPLKVAGLNLDKEPDFSGILSGIKGQYLLFEDGNVLNVRKFAGYQVILQVE